MKEKIMKICNEVCCDEFIEDTSLVTSGILDSFKIMQLISELESEFQIKLTPEEITNLEHFSSVNSIAEFVTDKIKDNS